MINGHGDDRYLYPNIEANFSSNVYVAAKTTALKQHLLEQLPLVLDHYPEPEPYSLQEQLAAYYHIPVASCLVTNGATEAIYLIAEALRGKKSVILQPTFSEYADACLRAGHQLHHIFSLSDIPIDTEVIWLCNPNNPTGLVYPIEQLRATIRKHSDKIFVLDQSYEYFTPKEVLSVREAITEYPNTIIIHSLTKRYLLPGLRLGYLTARTELSNQIRNIRMPWSVNALALSAGQWIVSHNFPETTNRPLLWKRTTELAYEISKIGGVRVYPSDTHILLIETPLLAEELKRRLAIEFGLLVRDASNFIGLTPYHIRIATQKPKWNEQLLTALKQILV